MNHFHKILVYVLGVLVLYSLAGCEDNSFKRIYYDDICIALEDEAGEIVIKEWSFLLGSGAEIYYRCEGKEILLGKTDGADDGFCPFNEGLYAIEIDNHIVHIKWCKNPSNKDVSWAENSYPLPLE